MSKIDTQGMSMPVDTNHKGEIKIQPHKPFVAKEIPMLEPKLKQELKDLINEVLDDRQL